MHGHKLFDEWGAIVMVALCVIVAFLPPKWDPAFWLKKWNERCRKKGTRR